VTGVKERVGVDVTPGVGVKVGNGMGDPVVAVAVLAVAEVVLLEVGDVKL